MTAASGTIGRGAVGPATRTMRRMKLRIASAALWFFVGWYAGAFLAEIFAVSTVLGPLLGAATAGILVGDPLRLVWSKPSVDGSARPLDPLPEAA